MKAMTPPTPPPTKPSPTPLTHSQRISIVRTHFQLKGYRVHSGLQFGCELVLYADSPGKVHSDFCVHIPENNDGRLDWRMLQTLVRSMPDLRKTLILANVREVKNDYTEDGVVVVDGDVDGEERKCYKVEELAIATEHAPFRHKNIPQGVGTQVKPQRRT